VAGPLDPVRVQQRRSRRRRAGRRHPDQLHLLTFHDLAVAAAGFRRSATVLVRGRMGQAVAIGLAREQARELGQGLALARAYDRRQAAWGDPRRAFVTGDLSPRQP